MKKGLLFSRVSTMSQDIVQQTEEIKAEAKRNGFDDDHLIYIEYKESAISLSEDERQGIQALKNAIENDKDIDTVFIYEISRLSRQTTMLYHIRDYLIEHGIQLICIKPYFRLLEDGKMSQTASILFSLFASISESEMYIKKERMMRGKKRAKENGKYIGGGRMFGYKIGKDKKMEIDVYEGRLVKRIFDMYVDEGKTSIMIGKELREEGHMMTHKRNESNTWISKILAREEYCGDDRHPKIIEREQFNKAREIAFKNKRILMPNTTPFLLKGIIRSKRTGNLLGSNRSSKIYMTMNEKPSINIKMMFIDKAIWDICTPKHMTLKKTGDDELYRKMMRDIQINQRKQKTIAEDMENLKRQMDMIEERLIIGKLSKIKADEMEKRIENEIEMGKKEAIILDREYKNINKKLGEMMTNNDGMIDYNNLTLEEKIKIIRETIDTVYVEKEFKKRMIDVEILFKDGERRMIQIWTTKKSMEN